MILGTSVRLSCDREKCPETGQIAWPKEWQERVPGPVKLIRWCLDAGWYLCGTEETYCWNHKPDDWNIPDIATPPKMSVGECK